jgi:hypothetical protein
MATPGAADKPTPVAPVLAGSRHGPLAQQIGWLQAMVRGYYNYHAIPGNMPALEAFRREVLRHWLHALRRRIQRRKPTWERFGPLADRCIPKPRILYAHPNNCFYAKHPR